MNQNPLVSVIITTHNRPQLLKETLQSVKNQSYKNIEIFVIDDNSSGQENKNICANFQQIKYWKIVSIGGPAHSRNFGASIATGAFLCFLDDDDLWLPEKIEIQIKILLQNPNYGLVHGPCMVINEHGEKSSQIIGRPKDLNEKHGQVFQKMIGNWGLMMPTPLFKKELFFITGGFRLNLKGTIEDVDFWTRMSLHTAFYYYDKPLALYRQHSGSISTTNHTTYLGPLEIYTGILQEYCQGNLSLKNLKKANKKLTYSLLKSLQNTKQQTFKTTLKLLDPLYFIRLRFMYNLVKRKLNL